MCFLVTGCRMGDQLKRMCLKCLAFYNSNTLAHTTAFISSQISLETQCRPFVQRQSTWSFFFYSSGVFFPFFSSWAGDQTQVVAYQELFLWAKSPTPSWCFKIPLIMGLGLCGSAVLGLLYIYWDKNGNFLVANRESAINLSFIERILMSTEEDDFLNTLVT
jgi:hypothetical protein